MTDHPTPEDARRLLEGTTPGPWITDQMHVRGARDAFVATARTYSHRVEQALNDARLIAAAPALAAALAEHEGCVPKAEATETVDAALAMSAALRTEREEARAAITLAVAEINSEHVPFRYDDKPVTDDNAVGCRACYPGDSGWPCSTRWVADDLARFLARTDTGGQE